MCEIVAMVFVMNTFSLSVVTPVTSSVLDTFAVVSCVAPVTPSVPVIVVSPALVTTNLGAPAVDPTSSCPSTLAPVDVTVMTFGVPDTPMSAPVNRTLSTSTY